MAPSSVSLMVSSACNRAFQLVFCCNGCACGNRATHATTHVTQVVVQQPAASSDVSAARHGAGFSRRVDNNEISEEEFRSYVETLSKTSCLPKSVINGIAGENSSGSSARQVGGRYIALQNRLTKLSDLAKELRIALMQMELSVEGDSFQQVEISGCSSESSKRMVTFNPGMLNEDLNKLFEFATLHDLQKTIESIQLGLFENMSTQDIWDKVIQVCVRDQKLKVKTDHISKFEERNHQFRSLLSGAARVQDLSAEQFFSIVPLDSQTNRGKVT